MTLTGGMVQQITFRRYLRGFMIPTMTIRQRARRQKFMQSYSPFVT
jgi:hypothetical protein